MQTNTLKISSFHQDRGAVFVELLIVLPILLIILAAGFEISRTIRFKNAAIQLSHQAASEVFRECSSDRAIMMSDCIKRVQREMTEFAMQISPNFDGQGSSHVAITVFFNQNNSTPQLKYTARADNNQFPQNEVFDFSNGINIDDWNTVNTTTKGEAQNILTMLDQVVIAKAYVRYRPIGFLFGNERIFLDNYITDFTVL